MSVEVGPFAGEADDFVFTPGGDLIATAFLEGTVRRHKADGSKDDLATGLPGINSIALTRDGARLFAGQVFMGEGLWEIDLAGSAAPRLVADHTGGLNAFHFGPDGMIYAPCWDRGQVVRVHAETGATTVLADGFGKPGAVDPRTGAVRTIVAGAPAFPRAVAVTAGPDGDEILVAESGHGALILDAAGGCVLSVAFGKGDAVLVASGLPVGYLREPHPRSGGMPPGRMAASMSRRTWRTRSTASRQVVLRRSVPCGRRAG